MKCHYCKGTIDLHQSAAHLNCLDALQEEQGHSIRKIQRMIAPGAISDWSPAKVARAVFDHINMMKERIANLENKEIFVKYFQAKKSNDLK